MKRSETLYDKGWQYIHLSLEYSEDTNNMIMTDWTAYSDIIDVIPIVCSAWGQWSQWSEWTTCVGPKCGYGKKTRTRSRTPTSTQVKTAVADTPGLILKSATISEVIGLRREEEDIDQ